MFPHRLQRKPKMTLRVASSSQSTPELFDYDNPAQEEVHVITTSSRIYSKILETQQGS